MIIMKKLCLLLLLALLSVNVNAQKTYAVITAVSRYQNSQANLSYTTKDAKALKKVFDNQGAIVSITTSSNATYNNIQKKMKAAAQLAKPEDKIIFFFSGHGDTGGILTYDMKLLMYKDMIEILSKSKAKEIVCFVDACLSGSVASLADDNYSWAGGYTHPGLIFVMSSRAEELSIENGWVGHGFFSQALLKGIRGMCDSNQDKKITLIELFDYIYKDVTARTQNYEQVQHPQLIGPRSMHNAIISSW